MLTNPVDTSVTNNGELAQNAQLAADEANKTGSDNNIQIKNINDPNYLSPFEKPQLEIQMDSFATIYAADKDIATSENIDFAAYDTAYQAYLAYMTPLIADMTTYSPIVRATFNSMVTAVQAEQKRFSTATQAQYNQQINQAQTDIANGQTRYQALQSDAETMKSSVAGVADEASRAISSAGFASDAASTASQAASSAVAAANEAAAGVTVAKSDAASAVAKAESTASEFGPVKQSADSAVVSALSAQSDASAAVAQATSAAADSKDAKQIAGAVSQSYKTLTDGSTMTIAELEGGLAAKLTKTDLNGYATQDWSQNQIKVTADSINDTMSSIKSTVDGQTTSINELQADSSGFKSQFQTVNDTIGKQTTDIGTLQSTSKELTTGFNTLTTDNGTNKNDISQLKQTSKEVNSTLETVQTQVQDSAVGTNLLTGTADKIVTGSNAYGYLSNETNDDFLSLFQGLEGETVTISVDYEYQGFVRGSNNNRLGWEIGIVAGSTSWFSAWYTPKNDSGSGRTSTTFVVPKNITGIREGVGYVQFSGSGTGTLSHLKLEKGSLATDWCPNPADNATVTAVSKISQTADSAQVLAANNQGDITSLQETAKGLQSSVNSKASSDQLTQLSDQLTNKISDLSSSTNSQFTQIAGDINGLVKKGDVVNQLNIDAGGILLDTSGSTAKIILSSNNIELDSANPVVMGSANITNLLTSKTIEASSITSTTKIIGSDIQAAMIHSADNSFSLNGATGDIVGASIRSADGAWGITANGKISGASVTSSLIDISGDGSGPNFDAENVTPDTATGIYSRYKYTNPNVGFDVNGAGREMYKNGYLVINGDTFLNRTIGDWSADGGGKYVYDTMYEANIIKMRAYNYTGSDVQTDDPSKTQGVISSRLDIQPSAITMGPDFSVGNPSILINYTGRIKGGLIATNAAHSIGTTDGGDLYFMQMNKDATNVDGSSIPIHVKGIYTSNLGLNNGHTLSSADGGGIYVKDKYDGSGNMVDLHVKKLYESSLLSLKTDIKLIDPHEALTEVVKNDVMGYHFKNDKTTDPKSVSVILDDINPIPKYYTSDVFKSADGTGRNDGNIVGYLMLSIKDLNSRLQKLEGTN